MSESQEAMARDQRLARESAERRAVAVLRRARLLADLAAEGAARCCYMPGAGNPDAWPTAICDCKYGGSLRAEVGPMSERTGCCEMRAAYRLISSSEGGVRP